MVDLLEAPQEEPPEAPVALDVPEDGLDVHGPPPPELRPSLGALENLMRGRTSIVVAHRLSTVAALDRIVVLEDGAIVEDGTHAELSRAGGTYESLWDRQTGAFLEAE